jgi:2-polyprenyl-6-methoxyphenol hydroxylase-like FAD-dependent oxidoreductase
MGSLPVRKSVAIIGAGLGGLTLGLVLRQHGYDPVFYELRDPGYDLGGAIMLQPNSLRVLDALGVYARVRSKGFGAQVITFLSDPDLEYTGEYWFGREDIYGYDAIRLSRQVLIGELRSLVKEAGVEIHYERRFTKVVTEDESGVVFEFADGTQEKADFLIGADGVHSKVRAYMYPDVHPTYSGVFGITYAFPAANLSLLPKDFPLPASIQNKLGSFIMAPQNDGGHEMFAGRQYKFPHQDRATWDALANDKERMMEMIQRNTEEWSPLVQSVQAQVRGADTHSLSVWQFDSVPKMDRWYSSTGRVIMLGDAAHGIPPSIGQGANQAFEDGYSLGLMLANAEGRVALTDALEAWNDYRQKRMDKVLTLTLQVLSMRMSNEEKAKIPEELRWNDDGGEGGKTKLSWLYVIDVKRDVERLLASLGVEN